MRKRAQPFDKVVGARIRIFRNQCGMSQTELAKRLGITFQQLQKNERGINRISFHRAVQIGEAFGVSVIELGDLDGANYKLPKIAPPKIDFQLLHEIRALHPAMKPGALKMLRLMSKRAKDRP